MVWRLPDGTLIEACHSGQVYGPDSDVPLQYGTSYLYRRINGGPWEPSPMRHLHKLDEWASICQTLEDFLYCEE
jgi:hypothetical protein